MKINSLLFVRLSIALTIVLSTAGTPNRKLPSRVYYMCLDYEFGFEEAILTLEKDQAYTLSYHSKERSHLILGYYEYRGDTLDLYPKSYVNRFWDCIAIGGKGIESRGEKDSSFLILFICPGRRQYDQGSSSHIGRPFYPAFWLAFCLLRWVEVKVPIRAIVSYEAQATGGDSLRRKYYHLERITSG